MELETLKKWTRWLSAWIMAAILLILILDQTPMGRDDTDSGEWGKGRSGMHLRTDALTGCQYLSVPGGGITPRLDGRGLHVGCLLK